MRIIPTASGATGPKNVRRGPTRPRPRLGSIPSSFRVQQKPDFSDVPMPSGYTPPAGYSVDIVEGPTVKTVVNGAMAKYITKETK